MSTPRALVVLAVAAIAPTAAAQTPFGPSPLPTLADPQRIAAGDVDGDGRADFVVGLASGGAQVFRGAGGGAFLPPVTLAPAGFYSDISAIELADVDNDGDRDVLLLGGPTQGGVVLHRNLGGGVFAGAISVSAGIYPTDLVVADLDGDGWLDAAIGSGGSTYGIRLMRNDGAGSFLPATTVPGSGTQLLDVCGADVDGDGRTDILSVTASTLSVIRSLGGGQFSAPALTTLPAQVIGVSAADFDGDGDQDVVIADYGGTARTLVNDGAGGFSTGVVIGGTTGTLQELDALDADGDGIFDVVWSDFGGAIRTARGLGQGAFAPVSSVDYDARSYAFADFDGDGDRDGAFAQYMLDQVLVLARDGHGVLGPELEPFGTSIADFLFWDLDGDGLRDVVGGSTGSNAILTRRALPGGGFGPLQSYACTAPARIAIAYVDAGPAPDLVVSGGNLGLRVHFGDGAGGFGPSMPTPYTRDASGFAAGDFTGDGLADVAYGWSFVDGAGYPHRGTNFLRGTGSGAFDFLFTTSATSNVIAIADWNADGVGDVARIESFTLYMLVSNGTGGFTSWSRPAPTYSGLDAADVDGDGRLDLLGGDPNTGVHVYWGDGAGGLSSDVLLPGDDALRGVPADFDQDGDLDVFAVTQHGAYVLEQVAPGVFTNLGALPVTIDRVSGLGLADTDHDGRLDLVLGGTYTDGFLVLHQVGVPGEAQIYCTSQTTSNGCVPTIATSGTPSATATSGFTITSSSTQNNRRGMLIYSLSGRAATPFQGGTLCVRAPVFRSPILMSGGSASGLDCSGSFARDWNAFVHGLGGGSPQPAASIVGAQVTAQWWSRDLGSFPGQTNLSNAVDFAVGP